MTFLSLKTTALALVAVFTATVVIVDTPAAEQPATVHAEEPTFHGVDSVVWQFDKDYPEGLPDDVQGGFSRVYLKTHDATDWMSTYDPHPGAINGPERFKSMVDLYRSQGIEVVAWFVPKGWDVETQLLMAKMIIDTGVPLYADLEPFPGFCELNCAYLADAFWARLRAERPDANLGVIYDPRPFWRDASAAAAWLSVANAALPMCYWESYNDQPPWNDPWGCVGQAAADLAVITGGRSLEYIPMLQGDTTAARFSLAIEAAKAAGSSRVSVWRRGVLYPEVWAVISHFLRPAPPTPTPTPQPLTLETLTPPCLEHCLVREFSSPEVHVVDDGEKVDVLDATEIKAVDPVEPIVVVPDNFLEAVPQAPPDCIAGWTARLPSRWARLDACDQAPPGPACTNWHCRHLGRDIR